MQYIFCRLGKVWEKKDFSVRSGSRFLIDFLVERLLFQITFAGNIKKIFRKTEGPLANWKQLWKIASMGYRKWNQTHVPLNHCTMEWISVNQYIGMQHGSRLSWILIILFAIWNSAELNIIRESAARQEIVIFKSVFGRTFEACVMNNLNLMFYSQWMNMTFLQGIFDFMPAVIKICRVQ